MPKFNCPTCETPMTPYWVIGDQFVETMPDPLERGVVEAFARCHPCRQTYLLNVEVKAYSVPRGPEILD